MIHTAEGTGTRRARSRRGALAPLVFALLALFAGRAYGHSGLSASTPAAGEQLSAVPTELRLTFTGKIELALARLTLIGPNGPVALGPLASRPDSAQLLIGSVAGPLPAGPYTVHWQIAGADGHPVRGEYSFTIAAGARGLPTPLAGPTAPGQTPVPAEHHEAAMTAGGFDAESPLYVAIRWITFVGLLGVIGVVAFHSLVLRLMTRHAEAEAAALRDTVTARAIRVGIGAVALLSAALLLRLYAQSYALHGAAQALDPGYIAALLGRTTWGWGWLLQGIGCAVTLAGFRLARRDRPAGWPLAGVGVVALAFAPALSGHAAAAGGISALAILADALHVLGAGGWLGSLLLVALVGIPAALKEPEEQRGRTVGALISAFSPTALAFAAIVVATGVFAAWVQLGSVPALWRTAYGQTLLLKLAVLSVVFGTGAYNWLKVKPALGDEVAAGRLRRSATLELAVGAVVLAVTAVLVATATPESGDMAHRSTTEPPAARP